MVWLTTPWGMCPGQAKMPGTLTLVSYMFMG